MKLYDAVELAARNLREAALRNSLTTIGIAVGVASLVAMLALGVGLQRLANDRLNRSGLFDTVVVFPQRDTGPGSERRDANTPERPLDDKTRAELARLDHVIETYPEIRFVGEIRAT